MTVDNIDTVVETPEVMDVVDDSKSEPEVETPSIDDVFEQKMKEANTEVEGELKNEEHQSDENEDESSDDDTDKTSSISDKQKEFLASIGFSSDDFASPDVIDKISNIFSYKSDINEDDMFSLDKLDKEDYDDEVWAQFEKANKSLEEFKSRMERVENLNRVQSATKLKTEIDGYFDESRITYENPDMKEKVLEQMDIFVAGMRQTNKEIPSHKEIFDMAQSFVYRDELNKLDHKAILKKMQKRKGKSTQRSSKQKVPEKKLTIEEQFKKNLQLRGLI